jgi:hypothetical protein
MGDNLVPNGLSIGCKVIYSRVDPADGERIRLDVLRRDAFMGMAIIARSALSPSTPRGQSRAPAGFGG